MKAGSQKRLRPHKNSSTLSELWLRAAWCLIFLLGGPNGLELQKRVVVERTDMPIIFITGYADIPKTVQAMKAGAVEFLTKPFNDEVFVDGDPASPGTKPTGSRSGGGDLEFRSRYAALTPRGAKSHGTGCVRAVE